MPQGQRIISKSDLLVLHRPQHSRRPLIDVRVTVESGIFSIQKCQRKCSIRSSSVNGEFDMTVVWVSNNCDVLDGNFRYSFEVITPEKSYILQATSHRAKIDWMQALSIATSQCLQFRGSYRPASWSNLDDLQLWLSVREVQHQFCEVKGYKGATYTGKWTLGKPQGIGSMEWPDGHRYDGEFSNGKIEGTGTMLWFSDQHKTSYTGSWKAGQMEGHGEMMYRNGSVYRGWWHGGIRYGHGRMEYKEPDSLYTGRWEKDMQEGYGVFHNSGEHYLGMWKSDKYHGVGILIRDGEYYCGDFRQGVKVGSISMAELEHDVKWTALFQWCADLLQHMVTVSHSNPDVSHRTLDEIRRARGSWVDALHSEAIAHSIGVAPGVIAGRNAVNECSVCTIEGFKSADHPFGMLVNHLTRCFTESYSGMAQHPNLLPHAIGELTSITTRLHQLVWRLCPTVIQCDEALLQGQSRAPLSRSSRRRRRRSSTRSITSSADDTVGDPTWLYPILLPSITDTLMGLYRVHCAADSKRLSATLQDLNEKTDDELCELLELQSEHENWKKSGNVKTFTELFYPVTQIFSKIGEYRTPLHKLLCIQETNAEVTQIYKSLHPERDSPLVDPDGGQKQIISSKLFTYVIVRSQDLLSESCLGSEIQFISDFAGSVLHTEEYEYLLTELKGCHQQLIDLYVDEDEWI